MRLKKIAAIFLVTALAVCPCAQAFGSSSPAETPPDGTEIAGEATTETDQETNFTGSGDKEATKSGAEEKTSGAASASGGEESKVSLTEEQTAAKETVASVKGQLEQWLNELESRMNDVYLQADGGTSMSNSAYMPVDLDEFVSLAQSALGVDRSAADSLNLLGGTGWASVSLPEVGISMGNGGTVYTETANGFEKTTVTEEECEPTDEIYGRILDEIGPHYDFTNGNMNIYDEIPTITFPDYIEPEITIKSTFNPLTGAYDYTYGTLGLDALDAFFNQSLGQSGYRTDLISGGFYDSDNWMDRWLPYANLTSNAMTDYVELAMIDEYYINTITFDSFEIVEYTKDLRRWEITDAHTGEPIRDSMLTQNPEHTLRTTFSEPGDYYITPYQEAVYSIGISASYGENQYMYEATTKNLLYYRERGTVGTVRLNESTYTGWVPSGETFLLHVLENGDVVGDDEYYIGIERVE